jgi:Kdo2-lipid IVA lauroyltransferase/acyltransferase
MAVRDHVELALYHTADALIARVPLETTQRIVAAGARKVFDAQGKNARWALANLRIAYPAWTDAERRALGRESYVNFGLNAIDYLRSAHWSDEEVLAHCPLEGLEHVEEALKKGKGALLLTLHIGAWEVGVQAIALGLAAHRPSVVGRPMRNKRLYDRITGTRTRGGAELIDRRRAAQQILRALRGGRPVGLLLDQYSRRSRGVFVPFFGVRCSTSAGMATLAVRTGAPVVPCYVLRAGPDRHRGIFLPELEIEYTGDRKRDIEIATACYNVALEKIVRANPEQWMWGHRRFRHSPDLDGDLYR